MKVLEWQQQFTHCKSMVIIQDAQGQLTLQVSAVQKSNSSKFLWLY